MATIKFRRGSSDPTTGISPTGLTLGEPVLNTQLNKFWIGASGAAGFTAIWVGAEIENSVNWNSPSAFKLATQAAIASRINTIVGASAGVQTLEGLSGTIDLVFGTGISGSTSAGTITLENTGVTRLGLSGDWRTRGVTNFGGAATGGVTLGAETWQGNPTPALNTMSSTSVTFGITSGTVLTGKTAMEILELMLVQYLSPSFSSFSMGFCAGSGIASSYATTLAFGISCDFDRTSTVTWALDPSGDENAVNGVTLTASTTNVIGTVTGTNVTIWGPSYMNSVTAGSCGGFTYSYKGTTYGSGTSSLVTFTLRGRDSQGSAFTRSASTINWYPRMYYGWTSNASVDYPPDDWKSISKLTSGTTSGELITATNKTAPAKTFTIETPSSAQYLYFWIDAYFSPATIKDADTGFAFDTVGGTSGVVVTGVTIDDGITTKSYRKYRSTNTQTSGFNITIG